MIFAIVYLATGVRKELRELSKATSDNVQWNLSQAEVEHLAFLVKTQDAISSENKDLTQLRRRFDILYSRVATLLNGELYAEFRGEAETAEKLSELRLFIDEAALLMDGPDAALIQALPDIFDRAQDTRFVLREVALNGIAHFSRLHDQRRQKFVDTLVNIGMLTGGLLVTLAFLVFDLYRLNEVSRARAKQIQLSQSRMSAIVTTSLDAIIAVDRHGTVIDFNGAAEDIFGYSEAEAIGAQMAELIIPDSLREAHRKGMNRYLKTGEKRVVDKGRVRLEGKRKNGEVFPVEFSIATAKGPESEIFVSYLRDISKEVEAEEELRKARDLAIAGEKSKSQLLAVMSHEMRTPLNGLLGTMELLSGTGLNDKQQRYLGIMEKSGNLLLSHVNDVLDISRLEAGKLDIEDTVFDLDSLLEDLVDGQKVPASNNGNTLRFVPGDAGRTLASGDPVRLRQVLLNLIGNAIKFTRNGEIIVESERLPQSDEIEIRVLDTGLGIEEKDLDRIFEDFATLDTSYGRRTDGTGLGLGIARRITHAMGGEIGVESEIGEGSIFWIRLPIAMDEDQPASAEKIAASTLGQADEALARRLDILLVEDNEINRMVARDMLEADHHRISEAHDGAEGVAFAERKKFDLILMDISMPEMDGTEATRAIRKGQGMSRNVPIIALTAHALEEDVRRFIDAGMNDVIVKPVSRTALRKAIASVTVGASATQTSNEVASGPVNLRILRELRQDIGEARFQELLRLFVKEMDAELNPAGRLSSTDLDGETLAKTAHRLSGSAAMFGAHDLRKTLSEIELSSKASPMASSAGLVESAVATWSETRRTFESML
ncbi:hybrid sensor histidine kinase/response regulator [Arenibacterium sp. CAU 1754]